MVDLVYVNIAAFVAINSMLEMKVPVVAIKSSDDYGIHGLSFCGTVGRQELHVNIFQLPIIGGMI